MALMRGKNLCAFGALAALSSSAFGQTADPAVHTAPYLVDASHISSGDTAWMLTSTALVLLMTLPGLALFYGGMVRKKNLLSTMAQSFAIACLVTVLWVVIGYTLAFTEDTPWLGGTTRFALEGLFFVKGGQVSVSHLAPTIPESVFVMFQLMFAIITPALVTGAFAERIKFSSMLVFMALWSLCVYVPMAHWVWSPDGWLASLGVLDFAGGTVVHINAGVTGLACVIMLGERKGYGTDPIFPHNLALTITGAALLWVGWFGFNAGSALAADGRAGLAFATTHCAAASAALTWMAIEWAARGKASVLGIASGAVAGLVAITPAAGFVGIGAAFGIHAVGGAVGAILTGVFASVAIGGVEGSITAQLIGIGACAAYSLVVSLILLMLISVTIGLRVSEEAEAAGLDVSTHGESVE
jgi:Amt family ammonium transporter